MNEWSVNVKPPHSIWHDLPASPLWFPSVRTLFDCALKSPYWVMVRVRFAVWTTVPEAVAVLVAVTVTLWLPTAV